MVNFSLSQKVRNIGLDISASSIKLIQLGKSIKGYKLENIGIAYLPPDAISGGEIKDTNTVAETIGKLIENLKIKTKNVTTSVSGKSVIIKKISLPEMSEKELFDSLEFEAAQHISYELSEVNLDSRILGPNISKEGEMEVLLVAAKKDLIASHTDVIKKAGLNPIIIDTKSFALLNAFELNYPTMISGTIALVEIGGETSSFVVVKDGIPNFMREIPLGGNAITDSIAELLELSYVDAETLKISGTIDHSIDKNTLKNIIKENAEEIGFQIKRSIHFYLSNFAEQIERIFICGGSLKLTGLTNVIEEVTSIAVEAINPFNSISIDTNKLDPEYINHLAPQSVIGVGLAIRTPND